MLDEVARFKRQEQRLIPDALDYAAVPGLSTEIRERLVATRPRSLGQASRIPGITPAAISILAVWCHRAQSLPGGP
jgi:tRNA uridine 5-carboxymethylaminomethyl modification enzyme